MHPPYVQYAFHKISDELREKLSQIAPDYQIANTYSHNIMREAMTY